MARKNIISWPSSGVKAITYNTHLAFGGSDIQVRVPAEMRKKPFASPC